jgi:hypothetical protein
MLPLDVTSLNLNKQTRYHVLDGNLEKELLEMPMLKADSVGKLLQHYHAGVNDSVDKPPSRLCKPTSNGCIVQTCQPLQNETRWFNQ